MTRIAVVTGGGSGIGKATVQVLAASGHTVVVSDVSDAGESTVAAVREAGGSALFVRADVAQPDQIGALFDQVDSEFGRLDTLVNSAGVTQVTDLMELGVADWDRILDINARGTFLAMQAAARIMIPRRGGSIVNVGSISAKGFKETSNLAYASSKAAVVNMTRIAATRLGPDGIRVNCVCPGMTKTEMWSSWIDGRAAATGVTRDALIAEMSAKVPLNRLNEPRDVAEAIAFLASDAARCITGQSLNVDGGTMWD